MRRLRQERRNFIDRIRISEFFALICTAMMLLTLFLLSSTSDPGGLSSRAASAGFSGNAVPMRAVPLKSAIMDAEPTREPVDEHGKKRPTRGIDSLEMLDTVDAVSEAFAAP